ncbi:MAG: VWA domain-containing protein [Candidatus Sumerlaeia bacterium]|nr:VWA domain-containing protein [Candidatus Sumerlaeia bacterium]
MRPLVAKLLLALLLLVAAPGALPAIALLLPREPGLPPLQLKSEVLDVTIDGPVARIRLAQVFHNPHARVLEGTFLVHLPRGAQVTDFALMMNGERVAGEVLEADQAREIYTDIVRRMRDPGLLEYLDAQTLRFRIFPIPARGDMPVELTFLQTLERDGDLYALELPAGRRTKMPAPSEVDLRLRVAWPGGTGPVYSPTHKLDLQTAEGVVTGSVVDYARPDSRGFRLLVAPAQKEVGVHLVTHQPDTAGPGTFLLLIHPPHEGELAKPMPKTVTFVLDVSGSMNDHGKIEQARRALLQCLGALGSEDHFNILTFSTGVDAFRRGPVPANAEERAAAREFITAIRARGGTNIDEALQRALAQETPNSLHQILFLTDGLPTVGVTDPLLIRKRLEALNTDARRVFALGVGFDVNTHLLDSIADDTRALSRYIAPDEDLEIKVSSLFESISYPVLAQLALDFEGAAIHDVYPNQLPDLFLGQNLLILGRYRQHGAARVTLAGNAAGKPWSRTYAIELPDRTDDSTRYASALWANRKVGYLLDEIRRHGESAELRDEVTALAKEYNLVTPYTSFLVIEDERRIEPVSPLSRVSYQFEEFSGVRPTPSPAPPGAAPATATQNQYRFTEALDLRDYVTTSGAAGVSVAGDIAARKQAETLAEAPTGSRDARQRLIAGASFRLADGRWTEVLEPAERPRVAVAYLSPAWFALLDRFPARREALLLGEQVTLLLADTLVEVGSTGLTDPAALPPNLR